MSTTKERLAMAASLMTSFAERTGLDSDGPKQRYLWTDAFAVCNDLALTRLTGEGRYSERALRLIDQVHHVLGRHRGDDTRTGWLSGLAAEEGERHPTRGGLRIGKPLPERAAGEPFDERLEWERDGQYFHYLTRWMHALAQVSRATGNPIFHQWAHRMFWKMSIDLSRPLVASMGQHDPLDGLVTCLELGPSLGRAAADFGAMLEGADLHTADALGLGGLLVDAGRLAQLIERDRLDAVALLDTLLGAARAGLALWSRHRELEQPPARRLAFRELGLAVGLAAAERHRFTPLAPYLPLRSAITSFWLDPERRRDASWLAHRDINDVMLATALLPEGYLAI